MNPSRKGNQTYAITTPSPDSPNHTTTLTLSEPSLKAENLSLTTWGSAFVLSNLLSTLRTSIPLDPFPQTPTSATAPGLDILELGAGTGLTGLLAATLYAREAVLTDLAPLIPALEANIRLNAPVLAAAGGAGRAGTLDWNEPRVLHLYPRPGPSSAGAAPVTLANDMRGRARLILAADTMYTAEHPRLLSGAIAAWLREEAGARAVVCYPLRVAYLDEIREFWACMEGVGLECRAEGRKEVEEAEWDDERVNEWSVWGWREEKLRGRGVEDA